MTDPNLPNEINGNESNSNEDPKKEELNNEIENQTSNDGTEGQTLGDEEGRYKGQEVEPGKPNNGKNSHKKAWIISAVVLVSLIAISIILALIFSGGTEDGEIYFKEDFENAKGAWSTEALDFQVKSVQINDVTYKSIVLAKNQYEAPHVKIPVGFKQISDKDFVVHFKLLVPKEDFQMQTLFCITLPTEPITLVMNDKGRLGFAHNIDQAPVYGRRILATLPKDKWVDIYVYVNPTNAKNMVYINNRVACTEEWSGMTSPVENLWLGSMWLGGSQEYQATGTGVSYADIHIGDQNTLPKVGYITRIKDLINQFKAR